MPQENLKQIRNEPLRLTLSGHERKYIEEGSLRSRRAVKILAIVSAVSLAGLFAGFFAFVFIRERYEDLYLDNAWVEYVIFAVIVVSAITAFVALMKLLFAAIEMFKFRRYRNDHQAFIKSYRR